MATITTTIKYVDNLSQLTERLQRSTNEIVAVEKSADRLAATLGGGRLIGAAHNAVAAIDKLGGVTKLTTQEQERQLVIIDKSIAKMERMGQVVPTAMRATADELRAATAAAEKKTTALERVDGALGKVGLSIRSLGVAGLVTGLVSIGRQAVAAAGEIVDLADKTKLSTTAVQQYGYMARQTGGEVTQWADAVFKGGVKIEQGSKTTRDAVAGLGLQYDQLRALKPEAQFDAIMRSLASIEGPQERNRLGVELLGKGYANVAAAVDDYVKMLGEAPVAGEAAVRATDAAADAVSRVWEKTKSIAIDAIGGVVMAVENAQKKLADLATTASVAPAGIAANTPRFGQRGSVSVNPFAVSGLQSARLVNPRPVVTPDAPVVPPTAAEDLRTFAQRAADAQREVASLSAATRSQIDAGLKLGESIEDLGAQFNLSADAQRLYGAVSKTTATAQSEAAKVHVLTGKALQAQVRQLAADVAAAGQQGGISAYQYEQLGAQLVKMREQGAVLPRVLDDIRLKHEQAAFAAKVHVLTMRELQQSFKGLPSAGILNTSLSAKILPFDPKKLPGQTIQLEAAPALDAMQVFGQGLSQSMLSAVQGGGNVGAAAGSFAGQSLGKHLADAAGKATSGFFASGLGKIIASSLPGIGALVGPLAGKLFNSIFGTAGRDAVVAFADRMGGFDSLREKLNVLGHHGERLWTNLTQGVGRNSPAEAAKAINAIEEALEGYEEQQRVVLALQQQLQGKIVDLMGAVDQFGGRAPNALRPMVQELLTINGLTAEQQLLLSDLLAEPGWREMEEAAERLGVKIGALGPAFQQAKLSEQALQTVRDLELLEQGGADMNAVLLDSSRHIQSLVTTAMNTGSQLPETLKPYIQRLIDLELLVDPAGELVRNIDQLSFADIEDDALNAIKGILEQIRDLLQNQIPNAARAAQSALDSVDIPAPPTVEPGHENQTDHSVRAHRGAMVTAQGIRRFHSGFPRLASDEFPAILQTGEAVLNRAATSVLGAGRIGSWNQGRFGSATGGGDSNVVINVYPTPGMSESQVAEMVYRRLPRRVKAGGR